jgi:hypothetical protein
MTYKNWIDTTRPIWQQVRGIRYGNQRNARAKTKITQRRIARAKACHEFQRALYLDND